MMKRWWIIALVATLALSLTSCSKRKKTYSADYGFGYCDGTIGSFDVYVIPSDTSPGVYDLSIVPVQVADPGDIAKVTITNSNLSGFRDVAGEVSLNDEQEINAQITDSDLDHFNVLVIWPSEPNIGFKEFIEDQGSSDKDAICPLPLPTDPGDPAEGEQALRRAVSSKPKPRVKRK